MAQGLVRASTRDEYMVPDIDFEKILKEKNPSGYRRLQRVAKSLLLPAKGKETIIQELQKALDFRLESTRLGSDEPTRIDGRLIRSGIAKIIDEGGLDRSFLQDLNRSGVSGGGGRLQITKDFYAPFSKDRSGPALNDLEKQVLGYARQQYLVMLLEDSITRDEAGNPVHDADAYYKRAFTNKFGENAPETYIHAIKALMASRNWELILSKQSQECEENLDKVEDQLRRATQRSNYNEQLAAEANQRLLDHHIQQRAMRAAIMEGRGLPAEVERAVSDMADKIDIPEASAVDGDDTNDVSSARRMAGISAAAAAAVGARRLRKSRKRCEYNPKPNSPPNVNENDREFNEIIRNDVIELFEETPKMFKDVETIVKETRRGDVYTYVLEMFGEEDPPFMKRLRDEMSAGPLQSPIKEAFDNLSDYRSLLEHRISPAFSDVYPNEPIFENNYGLPDILNEIISIVKNCAGGKQFTNDQQRMIQNLRDTLNPSQSFNYGMTNDGMRGMRILGPGIRGLARQGKETHEPELRKVQDELDKLPPPQRPAWSVFSARLGVDPKEYALKKRKAHLKALLKKCERYDRMGRGFENTAEYGGPCMPPQDDTSRRIEGAFNMDRRRSKPRRRSRSHRRKSRDKPRRRSRSHRRKSRDKPRRRSRSHRRKSRRRSTRRCWPGYKRVPGRSPYSKGSCVKK